MACRSLRICRASSSDRVRVIAGSHQGLQFGAERIPDARGVEARDLDGFDDVAGVDVHFSRQPGWRGLLIAGPQTIPATGPG